MDLAIGSSEIDIFKTLKCYLCGKYLSVGPVISISDEGKPYKCGRCKDIPSEKTIRNLCYEKVAAFLTFPCSYIGCEVKLSWEQVKEHEKFCQHRIIQCVSDGCSSLIRIDEYETHFKFHYPKRVFFGSIQNFALKKYCSVIFMLKNSTHEFFIVIRYYQGTLFVGVFSLQPLLNKTLFNLTITCSNLSSPSISYKGDVIEYDELLHCINCMRKKCHLSYHKFSVNYDNGGLNISTLPLEINFKALETLLLSPAKFIYSVTISNFDYATNINSNLEYSDNNSLSGNGEMEDIELETL